MISKRRFLAGTAAGVALGLAGAGASAQEKTLRVGFQKYGKIVLLKSKGTLEKALEPIGYKVSWTEFPAGPQLLEAVNVGAIDIGNTGEAPPIFAQAAGAPLVYVAYEPPAPKGEAILVPKGSRSSRSPSSRVRRSRSTRAPTSITCWSRRWRRPASPMPTSRRCSCAGRCARRLRARRCRCLGDLGSVPGRSRTDDRCAHARRRHRHCRQSPVLSRQREIRRRPITTWR
jgi:hypothetical protein